MEHLLLIIIMAVLLGVGYIGGTIAENRHFRALRLAEHDSRDMLLITFSDPPSAWNVHDPALVTGSVVISLDYFKRFIAGLKALFGGRITTYEPLLDRARREALLRMKAMARARGCDTVLNVRIETSCLSRSSSDNKGIAGIEILAFGTAVQRGA